MASHHNNKNSPFVVEKKEVVLIKPSKQTPSQVLSFSSIDNDLVLELICQTLYVYQASGDNHDHDPVSVIKDAISKVLVYYYPLAGKLKRDVKDGRLYLTCNGDGVPFLEATASCHLSSLNHLDGIDAQIPRQFIFQYFPSHEGEFGYHPLVFQLTKFSCGGFTIGMGLSHSICDGFGAAQFFTAMAELASGKLEPSVKPVWERERLLVRKTTSDRSKIKTLGVHHVVDDTSNGTNSTPLVGNVGITPCPSLDPSFTTTNGKSWTETLGMRHVADDTANNMNSTPTAEDAGITLGSSLDPPLTTTGGESCTETLEMHHVVDDTSNGMNNTPTVEGADITPGSPLDSLLTSRTHVQDPGLALPFKFNIFDGLAKSPYLPTSDIVHECFNVNSESIKHLKEKLVKENDESIKFTTFTTIEALGAYIWRARFRALKLNRDGKTFFFLATGIRKHLKPPLPSGYYGNAFVSSTSVQMGKNLNEGKLSETAKLIKESKKIASGEEYIWSELENREKLIELKMKVEGGNGATMVLTDWRQLGLLEQVDFGWKGPVNIIPVPWEMFGYVDLCFFMPPCNLDPEMKGGVRVLVSLPKAAMPKFKQEMGALGDHNI